MQMRIKAAIVLAALSAMAAPALAEGDAAAGEKVFNKCKACHQVGPDAANRVGPRLTGIVGRPTASIEDFKYSDAMLAKKDEGMVWDEEALEAYLADPKGFIPGNKMSFSGLRKEEEIENIIAFLATQ